MMRRAKARPGSQTTSATKATSKDSRHFWRGGTSRHRKKGRLKRSRKCHVEHGCLAGTQPHSIWTQRGPAHAQPPMTLFPKALEPAEAEAPLRWGRQEESVAFLGPSQPQKQTEGRRKWAAAWEAVAKVEVRGCGQVEGSGAPTAQTFPLGLWKSRGPRATEKGVSEYVVLALRALLVRHPTFYSAIESLPWVSVSSTKWEVCPDFGPLPQHIPWASQIQRR